VYPELSLTGYELDLAGALALSEDDPRLSPLLDAAASLSMTLIVGAPVRIGRRLHIGAFILSPDRAMEIYTKHHLGAFPSSASRNGSVPPAEATVFHPGARDPLVRFGGNVAAVAVWPTSDAHHIHNGQRTGRADVSGKHVRDSLRLRR
jgi:predicted amidohydrolase